MTDRADDRERMIDRLRSRTDAGAVCLDPDDGTVLWTRPAGFGGQFVVADDLVFAVSDRGVTAFRPP